MRYTIPLEVARESVGRQSLVDILDNLVADHVIQSYRVDGDRLIVEADAGVEAAFIMAAQIQETTRPAGSFHTPALPAILGHQHDPGADLRTRDAGRVHAEAAEAYYTAAEAFTRTRAFQRLPKRRRAIWRLHAQGLTKYEIAEKLGCPSGAVARAILALRPLAGLRRTSRTIPRGPQKRTTT